MLPFLQAMVAIIMHVCYEQTLLTNLLVSTYLSLPLQIFVFLLLLLYQGRAAAVAMATVRTPSAAAAAADVSGWTRYQHHSQHAHAQSRTRKNGVDGQRRLDPASSPSDRGIRRSASAKARVRKEKRPTRAASEHGSETERQWPIGQRRRRRKT